jgi:cytoskeleton protein RodZ
MIPAGQVRSVSGTPPFDLTIGNASDVSLEYRGKLIDLAPYTKKNVARVVLE